MSLAEEIKRVLTENPNILVEVLVSRPEIIYQALAKLTPWQELATKKDLEEIKKEMATKSELDAMRREMATKQELEAIRAEMATKKDLEEIKKVMATKEELEELKKVMATKEELEEVRKEVRDLRREVEEIKKVMATKDDIKALQASISALGARWGIVAEDVFRKGLVDLLLAETGWKVDREFLFDREGYVYGYPSDIEIDVVVKDGKVIIVELTASLKRGELVPLVKKRELYEKLKGVKVTEIVVVTPFVDDRDPERLVAVAKSMGIRVITPVELVEQ